MPPKSKPEPQKVKSLKKKNDLALAKALARVYNNVSLRTNFVEDEEITPLVLTEDENTIIQDIEKKIAEVKTEIEEQGREITALTAKYNTWKRDGHEDFTTDFTEANNTKLDSLLSDFSTNNKLRDLERELNHILREISKHPTISASQEEQNREAVIGRVHLLKTEIKNTKQNSGTYSRSQRKIMLEQFNKGLPITYITGRIGFGADSVWGGSKRVTKKNRRKNRRYSRRRL